MLSDMSADGILTPAEKLAARRDWGAVVAEFSDLMQRAGDGGIDATAYSTAYYALRAYLHSPAIYTSIDQYVIQALAMIRDDEEIDAYALLLENNITTGTESLAAYISGGNSSDRTAAVTALETDLHSQQKGDAAILNAPGNTIFDDGGQAYKTLWESYYAERTALLSALSGKALGELDDMASDDVLTDIEKLAIIREYERVKQETRELLAQASAAGIDNDSGSVQYAYRQAYSSLYAYLDDKSGASTVLTDPLTAENDPGMLYDGQTTGISGTTFTSLWSGYYNAAASLRAAIRSAGHSVYVGTNPPSPPYSLGDLWVKTSGDKYTLMICIQARSKGQANASDWTEHTVYKDARGLLASLADYVFAHYSGSMPVTVTLGATCSISGNVAGVSNTLTLLYHFLGACSFTISTAASLGSGTSMYDLCCVPVTFQIPGSQEVLTSGCRISMWNGTGWEFLQESTSALLENLGNKINAVVFGSSQGATEASGMTIGSRFLKLFSEAQVWDPTANNGQGGYVSLANAVFGLDVTKVEYTEGGETKYRYTSNAKLHADNIDFTANNFKLGAERIDFAGKDVSLGADESLFFKGGIINFTAGTGNGNDGEVNFSGIDSLNLNANTVNFNADKINWKQGTNDGSQNGFSGDVITGSDGNGGTETKFHVDQDGNVTMNNLTARNGTFEGELKTLNGRIVLDETAFSGYTWYGLAGGSYNNVSYTDAFAFGLRDYNGQITGHLTLHGRGTYGGVFDVVTGDQSCNKSMLKMGANALHVGVEIDGVAGSLKLKSSSSTTKATIEGINGNGTFDGTVQAGAVKATSKISAGSAFVVGDAQLPSDAVNGQMVFVRGNGSSGYTVSCQSPHKIISAGNQDWGTSQTLDYNPRIFFFKDNNWYEFFCG
jgi:hypothetical protein